jgi:hypothetical protein
MPAKEGQPPRWAFAFANPGPDPAADPPPPPGEAQAAAALPPAPPRWLLNLLHIVFLQGNTFGGHRAPFLRVWQPNNQEADCKAYVYKVWTRSEFEKMLRNIGLELSQPGLSAGDAPLDGPLLQRSQSGLTKARHTADSEYDIPKDRVSGLLVTTMPRSRTTGEVSAALTPDTFPAPGAAADAGDAAAASDANQLLQLQRGLPDCKKYIYAEGTYWELGNPVARAIATLKKPSKVKKEGGQDEAASASNDEQQPVPPPPAPPPPDNTADANAAAYALLTLASSSGPKAKKQKVATAEKPAAEKPAEDMKKEKEEGKPL